MANTSITHQTTISANVVMLCRFLRTKKFSIGPEEEVDALKAIQLLPIHKEFYFKNALKAILAKNAWQRAYFDDLYSEFNKQLGKASDAKLKDKAVPKKKLEKAQAQAARFEALKSWLNLKPSADEKAMAAYSNIESLTKKDFKDLSEEELQLTLRLLKKMARKLAHQKSRLKKKSHHQKTLDIKRSIRVGMRNGGDIQKLIFSEKKIRRLKLVVLCDVSKSMELYSRFFVHLIYAFQNAYDKIETLVFSTALHHISELLNQQKFDAAFETISEHVPQWSGGTTIGSCLSQFVQDHSHGMLDRKTIVLILSDGWDTGEPAVLATAMKTIYKKSRKVIWLNPLAGSQHFSPEALGLKTALPYIDVLASAHNLDSLKRALQQLKYKRKVNYVSAY